MNHHEHSVALINPGEFRMGGLGWKIESTTEDVHLVDGTIIPESSTVAVIHFDIPKSRYADWQVLSLAERARTAAVIGLGDLIRLAEQCVYEHPNVEKIDVFKGSSHFVKRRFFEELGFTVKKPDSKTQGRIIKEIEQNLWQIYGFEQGDAIRTERINEFWATPQQIISALPKLMEKRDHIQARLTQVIK